MRLREGRYLDQSCFQVVTGKSPRLPDSPSSALREGTAPSRAPRHMYITPLTIWFLAVFLNDLVDLSVQFFVFSGYLNRKNSSERNVK